MHCFNSYYNNVVNKLLMSLWNSFNSFAAKCTRACTGHHLVITIQLAKPFQSVMQASSSSVLMMYVVSKTACKEFRDCILNTNSKYGKQWTVLRILKNQNKDLYLFYINVEKGKIYVTGDQ